MNKTFLLLLINLFNVVKKYSGSPIETVCVILD